MLLLLLIQGVAKFSFSSTFVFFTFRDADIYSFVNS